MAIFMSTTARINYACPRCGAEKGEYCRTPKGRTLSHRAPGGVHGDRIQLLTKEETDLSKFKIESAEDI